MDIAKTRFDLNCSIYTYNKVLKKEVQLVCLVLSYLKRISSRWHLVLNSKVDIWI